MDTKDYMGVSLYIYVRTSVQVKISHLRESLEDERQHLQHRLPAHIMLVLQLSHHEGHVVPQLPAQWVVQQVLQIDLPDTNTVYSLPELNNTISLQM